MKEVYIYTDGACSGNPGKGGYCAILTYNGKEKVISGSESDTTNNRMELTSVIVGLEALKEECEVTVTSDSKYVVDAIEKKWLDSWRKNSWKKSNKKPVLNVDLWERLIVQLEKHKVGFVWIKGHAGHPFNERCDRIAVEEYNKI